MIGRPASNGPLVLAAEIHVQQPFMHLNDAILQTGANPQLVALDRKHQRRLRVGWDVRIVELHQTAQRRDDDGARPGEANLLRDVRRVTNREVAIVERDVLTLAVLDERLDGRFDQADATVVAVLRNVLREIVDATEPGPIVRGQDDVHRVPLVQDDLGPEVGHAERDRPPVIAIRRIADERGTRVGALTNENHGAAARETGAATNHAWDRRARTPRMRESTTR